MLAYDPHNWIRALALHKADTFLKLWPLLLVVGVYTGAVTVEVQYN